MKQVWITKAGAPEVLQVREAKDPDAGEGEVRVRVRAAGINFADLMARMGLYPDAPPLPCVIGYEVAGVIDQLGKGVTGFSEGQKVFAMPRFGGYTDTLVISSAQVMPIPDGMSFEAAAGLPVVYLTAYTCMFFTGYLRPGATVLIHSAAGGVGLAAIELAKTRGATIIGTASASKHDFLREHGVQHCIDSSADIASAARDIVGDKGVDLILDPIGGRSWTDGYDLLGPCGRIVAFGLSAAASGKTRSLLHALVQIMKVKKWSPQALMNDNKTITGVNMGHLFDRLDLLIPQFEELITMYKKGQIQPRVDKTFSFDDAPLAHHYIHDRKAKGKVVLVP
jgi:NADPH:quinone reductase-like Zn-dependent oxidoreductase